MSAPTASAPAGKSTSVAGSGPVVPELLWAQRANADETEKNVVMLTINVPNLPAPPATKIDLTSTGFDFHAKTGDASKGIPDKEWKFHLDFFAEVDPEASKVSQTSKSLYLVLRKKDASNDYWPRLSKEKVRLHNVKTDFAKWRDEDEQDEFEDLDSGMGGMGGMGGMDPSMMMGGGGGGMPGMGGGAGGMGGMDIQSMLAQMGGGGAGGMPDMSAFGGGEGGDDFDDDDEGDDDDADAAQEPLDTSAAESEASGSAPSSKIEETS